MSGRPLAWPAAIWGRLLLSALVALTVALGPSVVEAGEGIATWFGQPYHGRRMANGQLFDMYDPTTTASREFALGTWLQVTGIASGTSIEVQVRDRGSFAHALDLSYAAFEKLAPPSAGVVRVRYEVIPGPGRTPVAAAPAAAAPAPIAPAPAAAPIPRTAEPNPGGYRVEAGDTLASIARRHGVTVAELVDWNELDNPNALRPGWVLRLEPPTAVTPSPAPAVSAAAVAPVLGGEVYVVQDGDTLWRIADRFEVDSHELARVNGLGPDGIIRAGQSLTVPIVRWYEVQTGDSLGSIAADHQTTVEVLVRLNELENPDHVVVGQSLRVR